MKITPIAVALLAVACGGSHGTMRTDTPILAYQKPDVSEITGVPEPEPSDGAPAATPGTATPSAPTKSLPATKPAAQPSGSPKK